MNKVFALIFLFIFLAAFWVFWSPGPRVANDYHLGSLGIIKENSFPWIWRETAVADGLGEYTATTLWSQPIHVFFRVLSELNISVIWITKILLLLILACGFLSITKLLSYLKIEIFAKYVGVLFYLSNSFFLLLIDGGQLSLALVYAIVPLTIYFYLKTVDKGNLKNRLKFVFSLMAVSFLDIRFVFLVFLLFFIHFLFKIVTSTKNESLLLFEKLAISGVLSGLILLLAHTYWLLPVFFSHKLQLPQAYERVSQVDFLSLSSLTHSLFLQQPHWYQNIFGRVSNPKIEFSLIPLLVFLAPFLRRKNKIVGFWLIVAIIGIFLSKGSQPPLGEIYNYLFTYFPGFSLFRDPVKFYLFITLSYSVLISISVSEISALNFNKQNSKNLSKLFPYMIFIYLLLLMWPIYLKQMTGIFSEPRYEDEYSNQTEILSQDQTFSRIVWIPTHAPLGYSSINHPWVGAAGLSQERPFAIGSKGTYETFNFLREAPFMGQIFDVVGIGYIAYPYLDPQRDEMSPDNIKYFYTFLDQLSKLPWLTKISNSKIPLFKVNEHQDRFFITPNVWWVIGSDSIYNEATKSASLRLTKNALIFSEQYPGLGNRIDTLPEAKIVLNSKTTLDLAASFINPTNLIFPAKKLDFEPDTKSGWWKREAVDLIRWREFLQIKYGIDNQDFDLGGGWAVGEGDKELKIRSGVFKKGSIVLARVLESTRSGQLKFYQDIQQIGEINTKKEGNNIRWFEVGELPKDGGPVEIKSFGEINVVNALAVLDKNEWGSYQNKANKLQGRIISFDEKNAQNDNNPTVTYQKINPTKYLVNISGLTRSGFLIFSQNYDGLWKMSKLLPPEVNGQTPLPVYSLLNGFRIEKEGQYTVEFSAQKYVNLGLVISGLTAVSLVLLLIKSSKSS